MSEPIIINLVEGRGKSGNATRGPIRMMFRDQDDHESFYNFTMRCRQWVIDRGQSPVEPKEYFLNSVRELLGKQTSHVFELRSGLGDFVYLVNRSRLNVADDLNIEAIIHRMHKENLKELQSA